MTLPSYRTTRSVRLLAAATALTIGISGCAGADSGDAGSTPPPTLQTKLFATPSTSTSAAAQATDYRDLLLTASDLSDAEDTFTERSRDSQPNGAEGASAFFVNDQDNRAISDTVLIYPDAATASATLRQAAGTLPSLVQGGTPTPVAVGTDGTMISGTSPDGQKAVTLVLFTEGRALVRLEFESAAGDATTEPFVINVGKMQQIALRTGLADAQ